MINIKVEDLNNNNIFLKENNDNLNKELKEIKVSLIKEKYDANNLIISNNNYIEELEDLNIKEEENQKNSNDIIADLNVKINLLKDNLFESNNSNENLVIEVIYFFIIICNN